MNTSAIQVIDALGGTAAVARIFEIAMPSVSAWKEDGIPPARMMFLRVAHKKALVGFDLCAATAKAARHRADQPQYQPPPQGRRDDESLTPFIPDWSARQVQLAMQAVPIQFRRVLFAIYIPQREYPMASRRRLRLKRAVWDGSRIEGLRSFWSIYRLRYLTKDATIGLFSAILIRVP